MASSRRIVIPGGTFFLLILEGTAEGCLGPVESLPMGCLVARSLNIVRQRHTQIELINVSNTSLIVEQGQKLANF